MTRAGVLAYVAFPLGRRTIVLVRVRFGVSGWHATQPWLALAVVAALAIFAASLSMRLFSSGWKIKA